MVPPFRSSGGSLDRLGAALPTPPTQDCPTNEDAVTICEVPTRQDLKGLRGGRSALILIGRQRRTSGCERGGVTAPRSHAPGRSGWRRSGPSLVSGLPVRSSCLTSCNCNRDLSPCMAATLIARGGFWRLPLMGKQPTSATSHGVTGWPNVDRKDHWGGLHEE